MIKVGITVGICLFVQYRLSSIVYTFPICHVVICLKVISFVSVGFGLGGKKLIQVRPKFQSDSILYSFIITICLGLLGGHVRSRRIARGG